MSRLPQAGAGSIGRCSAANGDEASMMKQNKMAGDLHDRQVYIRRFCNWYRKMWCPKEWLFGSKGVAIDSERMPWLLAGWKRYAQRKRRGSLQRNCKDPFAASTVAACGVGPDEPKSGWSCALYTGQAVGTTGRGSL